MIPSNRSEILLLIKNLPLAFFIYLEDYASDYTIPRPRYLQDSSLARLLKYITTWNDLPDSQKTDYEGDSQYILHYLPAKREELFNFFFDRKYRGNYIKNRRYHYASRHIPKHIKDILCRGETLHSLGYRISSTLQQMTQINDIYREFTRNLIINGHYPRGFGMFAFRNSYLGHFDDYEGKSLFVKEKEMMNDIKKMFREKNHSDWLIAIAKWNQMTDAQHDAFIYEKEREERNKACRRYAKKKCHGWTPTIQISLNMPFYIFQEKCVVSMMFAEYVRALAPLRLDTESLLNILDFLPNSVWDINKYLYKNVIKDHIEFEDLLLTRTQKMYIIRKICDPYLLGTHIPYQGDDKTWRLTV